MVHHTAVSLMGSSTLSAVHTTRVVVIVTPPPPGQQIIVMCMSVCSRAYLRNYTSNLHPIFTARPYASAVYAVVVRPSVRPSQKPVLYRNYRRIELVLAWRLPSTYPTLCFK